MRAALLALAVGLGAWLRLQQFAAQVLIDDEWHAVHQVMHRFPSAMLLDFGFADYSIPLGVLYWLEAQWFGLSELAMRWPMMLAGLATLVVLPLYVARRVSWPVALLFALLLAFSPLLVVYSRMARPYALTLLLGWVAHAAFARFRAGGRAWPAGTLYVTCAALATWLHTIVGPFVFAPLVVAAWDLRRASAARRTALARVVALGLIAGAVTAALALPPLVANAHSMVAKSGKDAPDLATLVGAAYLWLGTPSTPVVVLCIALAALGTGEVWRRLPEARTGVAGLALTALALYVTRPMFSHNPISLARYLLPFVPLLLLGVAAGTLRMARVATAHLRHPRVALAAIALVPAVALAVASPLAPMLRRPNGETLHFLYHFDFRPDHNPYVPYMAHIPLSPFWATLAQAPPGSLRIAAAPFHFESYDWDAPRWEAVSHQHVIPGWLTGLCVDERPGEVPAGRAFRFRNAVHLASAAELASARVDWVVWQKPYRQVVDGQETTIGEDTEHCVAPLRARFGAPAYEDSMLVAWRVARGG